MLACCRQCQGEMTLAKDTTNVQFHWQGYSVVPIALDQTAETICPKADYQEASFSVNSLSLRSCFVIMAFYPSMWALAVLLNKDLGSLIYIYY